MKKHIGFVCALLSLPLFGLALSALAQTNAGGITFPVAELGNCGSQNECKTFCDDPANSDACFAFATAHNLVSDSNVKAQEELKNQRKDAIETGGGGPGGCNSEASCRAFCDDPTHAEECLNFVKKHELVSKEDLKQLEQNVEQVKRRTEVIKTGNGPGGCNSQESCQAFCADATNRKTCFEYAREHQLLAKEELDRIEKEDIRRPQTGPGGCTSKEACDAFCRTPQNVEACLNFAVTNGYINENQANQFRQFNTQVQGGRGPGGQGQKGFGPQVRGPKEAQIDVAKAQALLEKTDGPGGCKSFEECSTFCNDPANEETCFAFAREHELMPTEEIQRVEKLRNTVGPGGCKGRECETYCNADGREEECLGFAIDNGFVADEEIDHAKKFLKIAKEGGPGGCRGRQCESFCQQSENQQQCFEFAKKNQLIPQEEIERTEKMMTKLQQGGGPGGCRSENECRSRCSDPSNFDECAAFAVNAGIVSPDEALAKLQEFVGAGAQTQNQGQGGFGRNVQGFGGFNQNGQGGDQGGFGGPQGFQGQGGFNAQGFGPGPNAGPSGSFPGRGGGIPPQMQGQFNAEFQKRFEQFQQFRSQFENGGNQGPGSSGGMMQEGENGMGGFPGNDAGQFGEQRGETSGPGSFGGPQGTMQKPRTGPMMGGQRMPLPSVGGSSFQMPPGFDHPQGGPGGPESVPGYGNEFNQQFKNQMNQQMDEQFKQQFNQEQQKQFNEQYKQQSSGLPPPGGAFTQPNGTQPSGGMTPPQSGSYPPPSGGTMPPSSGSYPLPSGSYTPPSSPTSTPPPPPTDTPPPPPPAYTPPPPTSTPPPTYTPPPSGSYPPPSGGGGMPPPGALLQISRAIANVFFSLFGLKRF